MVSALLEIREKISEHYGKYERYVRAGVRFFEAFLLFAVINYNIGSVAFLNNYIAALVLAVICVFVPEGVFIVATAVFIIIHIFGISIEAGAVAVISLLIMILLYLVFRPRYAGLIPLFLLAGLLNVSGAVVIPVGLLCSSLAMFPAGFGILSYGIILTLKQNYSVLEAASDRLTSLEKVVYYINNVLSNERVLLLLAAAVITILVVCSIRRIPHSYAWGVAISSGLAVYVLVIMIGNVVFGINSSLLYLSVSIVAGVLISLILHVFYFLIDGVHAEFLQYEDDEYVYYVKAIPKYSVSRTDKKITSITGADDSVDDDTLDFIDGGMTPDDYFRG